MRTTTTQESKVLALPQRQNTVKVWVKDSGGTWTNLAALRNIDWVRSVEWTESVDNFLASATVTLVREQYSLSLANLMSASVFNVSAPLLELHRELKIETATVPLGTVAGSGDYHMVFHGYIDSMDWGQEALVVQCRDLSGLLQDTFIETERDYGVWAASRNIILGTVVTPSGNLPNGQPSTTTQFWKATSVSGTGTTGASEPSWPASPSVGATITDNAGANQIVWTYQAATVWAATTSYTSGAYVSNPSNSLQYWQCTVSGTSGGSNPFPSSPTQGQTVTDSGATWQYYASLSGTPAETILQSLINDSLTSGSVTLSTPSASNWYLGAYTQKKDNLYSAICAIAQQLGWDLRYWWSDTSSDFLLTFQSVNRSSPSSVWTFPASQYRDIRKAVRSVDGIRNAISVVYSDAENLDTTTQQPKRTTVVVTDSTSITKYGRRFMEVAEAAASAVSTNAIATVFANAMLSDLKEPLCEVEVDLPYFWAIQLNDYVTMSSNGHHWDSDQNLAVVSIKHTLADGSETTTLGLRGLPTLGTQKHLDVASGMGQAPPVYIKPPKAAQNVTSTVGYGTASISYTPVLPKGASFQLAELHISTSNGFTPSAATLRDIGFKGGFDITGLTPGTTYYAKILMRDQRGNVSSESAQQTLAISGLVSGSVTVTAVDPTVRYMFAAHQTSDGTPPSSNSTAVVFGTKDYDSGLPLFPQYSTVGGYWLVQSSGKYQVYAQVEISGVKPGDALQLMLRRTNNTAAWVAAGPVCQATSMTGRSVEVTAYLFANLVATYTDQIELRINLDSGVSVGSLTLKAASLSSSPFYQGSFMSVSQLLTS